MTEVRRGRLPPPSDAPATGETYDHLARTTDDRTVVEQILTGRSDTPVDFLQTHDEWVTVLAGAATLEVAGEIVRLTPGDWVVLPANVPHTVTNVDQGTSWLAFHFAP
ncbi:MAG: cupin 2 protein [Actinomycetota bacterium]|jgi:cupin 2 domain-containing protein|nr:cupin 2 protein [Actinomycetota bacterium]